MPRSLDPSFGLWPGDSAQVAVATPGRGLFSQHGVCAEGCLPSPSPSSHPRSALLSIEQQPRAPLTRQTAQVLFSGEARPHKRFADFFSGSAISDPGFGRKAVAGRGNPSEFFASAPRSVFAGVVSDAPAAAVAAADASVGAPSDAPAEVAPAEVPTVQGETTRAEMQAASAMQIAREAGEAAEKAEEAADHAEEAETMILFLNAIAGLSMLGVAFMTRRTYMRWMAHQKRYAECYRAALESNNDNQCSESPGGNDFGGAASSTTVGVSKHTDGAAHVQL